MRHGVILGALLLTGCGAVYTSPDVYESGGVPGAEAAFDVAVVPMNFETAMEANLAPYVPARLPAAFAPPPVATPAALRSRGMAMPDIPDPDVSSAEARAAGGDALPDAATRAVDPRDAGVNLPDPQQPQPYRIGVADVLLLSANTAGATLDDVPTLLTAQSSRQGYIVQDDGAIAIPDVGRVRVSGLTLEEAEAEIFQALVAQRLDPSFSLEIAEFNSQRISVGGAVRNPSVQPISLKPLYLSEALQLSGGVAAEDPDYALVRLYRQGRVFQAPLREVFGTDDLTDVLLRDGDAIFVDASYDLDQARAYFREQLELRAADLREREFAFRQRQADIDEVRFGVTLAQFELQKAQLRQQIEEMRIAAADFDLRRNADLRNEGAIQRDAFRERLELGGVARDYVYVGGEVRQMRRMALPFETRASLADALFDGQGLSINFADYAEIYVLRRDEGRAAPLSVTAYRLNARNAANLTTATLFELRPDDVVFVAEQPVTTFNRIINQLTPTLLGQGAAIANVAGN